MKRLKLVSIDDNSFEVEENCFIIEIMYKDIYHCISSGGIPSQDGDTYSDVYISLCDCGEYSFNMFVKDSHFDVMMKLFNKEYYIEF